MEKKRSPRSSKSPGSVIFPKSPLVYEGYKSGCGWKMMNLFGFKNVKSGNNRLGSDKKFVRDSAGNVYTKSQLDLLKRLHEKCQCNDRIVEEESSSSSCKPKARRRSLSSEREDEHYESEPAQGEIKRIKNRKDESCGSLDKQKHSSCSGIEKRNDKDKSKKSAEINLQVRVNDAAETLICSKVEDKGKDRSKQFMEALDILSSNKELFITLLQDPNSFSANKEPRDKDLDDIVLLKPRLLSSVDERMYLRFKHLAKKLKLVVGSNKEVENKPECSGKGGETEATAACRTGDVSTSMVGYRSPESPVFKRKKRVESDVFKLSTENDVLVRRYTVERQQERSCSSPVYEVPNAMSSWQTKIKERRQKLEKRRESFKLWSSDKNLEVFDPKSHSSNLRYLDHNCTEYTAHVEDRYPESSLTESDSSLERPKQEEQPSPVSVLERIHLENETASLGKMSKLEEHIGLLSCNDPNMDLFEKDSVLNFVKKVLKASRLNWTSLVVRCNEETSILDEFSHGYNHHNNKNQLLLVLDYTDEILRDIYRQAIKFYPYTPLKNSRVIYLRDEDLIHETMRRFNWSLVCYNSPPTTLDQIMDSDMSKPCPWLDFGGESEGVVSDVVEKIVQQLVLEMSHELRTMQQERRVCRLI